MTSLRVATAGLLAVAATFSLAVSSAHARAPFPLQPGEAIATCKAPNAANSVVGIIDVRDPECDTTAVKGANWPAPMYHNEQPNPTLNAADEWTQTNLGTVFGITLDDADPPSIYVSSTSIYGGSSSSGKVFRLDGSTGAITVFATLPNSAGTPTTPSPGLGDIAYDRVHRQFFVTNSEDGMIYRLSMAGAVIDSFDPFLPDNGLPGLAPLGEILWAVQVHDSRVYFSAWAVDSYRPSTTAANTIWSVGLDAAAGGFAGSDLTLEVTMPPLNPNVKYSNPVSDIAFADDDWMVVAERGTPHSSRVLEFSGGHLGWSPSPHLLVIGKYGNGTNSAGGIDYDCPVTNTCNSGRRVWASGDALRLEPGLKIYGIQGTPDTGGTYLDSYLVDFGAAKGSLGDVEVYRPVCTIRADAGPGASNCGPADVTLDGSATIVQQCATGLEYRWLQGATIVRDWSAIPTVTVRPTRTASYRLEARCGRCPCFAADAVTMTVAPDVVPGDLGNTLLGVKAASNADFSWRSVPEAATFSVYRGVIEGSWPATAVRAGLTQPRLSLPDVPSPPDLYFYRAAGVSCSGKEGL